MGYGGIWNIYTNLQFGKLALSLEHLDPVVGTCLLKYQFISITYNVYSWILDIFRFSLQGIVITITSPISSSSKHCENL